MNEAYLFLYHSPKWQRMFELTLHEYLPNSSSHSKLPGLCQTRCVERHTCYAIFHEMYEVLVTFLDAILSPQDYPELVSQGGSWNWNSDTKTKAQGLKNSLLSNHSYIHYYKECP